MYNLYTKFVKILEICKQFSENLVNESGNVPRHGPVPKFSDLEVVALSLTAETESIDSEKWLFDYKLQEYKDCIPNLISRRQFNDRRKKTAGLCEELRKRVVMEMDGGEEQFFVDSKPIEVCRVARGKRCEMGRTGDFSQAPDFGFCASQNTYYFGYKLHAICGFSGVIHSYDLSKASVADFHYMKDVKHAYHDCSIYGDKGILELMYSLTCSKPHTKDWSVRIGSTRRTGSRHSFRLQRQERGLRQYSHNLQTSSCPSETMRK